MIKFVELASLLTLFSDGTNGISFLPTNAIADHWSIVIFGINRTSAVHESHRLIKVSVYDSRLNKWHTCSRTTAKSIIQ
jgi:hypothetical protein